MRAARRGVSGGRIAAGNCVQLPVVPYGLKAPGTRHDMTMKVGVGSRARGRGVGSGSGRHSRIGFVRDVSVTAVEETGVEGFEGAG